MVSRFFNEQNLRKPHAVHHHIALDTIFKAYFYYSRLTIYISYTYTANHPQCTSTIHRNELARRRPAIAQFALGRNELAAARASGYRGCQRPRESRNQGKTFDRAPPSTRFNPRRRRQRRAVDLFILRASSTRLYTRDGVER